MSPLNQTCQIMILNLLVLQDALWNVYWMTGQLLKLWFYQASLFISCNIFYNLVIEKSFEKFLCFLNLSMQIFSKGVVVFRLCLQEYGLLTLKLDYGLTQLTTIIFALEAVMYLADITIWDGILFKKFTNKIKVMFFLSFFDLPRQQKIYKKQHFSYAIILLRSMYICYG